MVKNVCVVRLSKRIQAARRSSGCGHSGRSSSTQCRNGAAWASNHTAGSNQTPLIRRLEEEAVNGWEIFSSVKPSLLTMQSARMHLSRLVEAQVETFVLTALVPNVSMKRSCDVLWSECERGLPFGSKMECTVSDIPQPIARRTSSP